MSGGSYNYAYRHVEDLAESIWDSDNVAAQVARNKFKTRLKLVAEAMRAIEWVDSCDCSPGDEIEPIRKALEGDPEVE